MIVVRHEWQLVGKNIECIRKTCRDRLPVHWDQFWTSPGRYQYHHLIPSQARSPPVIKLCWFSGHLNLVISYLTESCSCYWITAAEPHVGLGRDRLKLLWSISEGLRDSMRIWVCNIQVRLSSGRAIDKIVYRMDLCLS